MFVRARRLAPASCKRHKHEMIEQEPDSVPAPRQWRLRTKLLVGTGMLLGGSVLLVWLSRQQLADLVITRQLDAAGVQASYEIERVSARHQRLINVRIGNSARADLTAREVDVWLGYGWSGPQIERVRARGVRLRGTVVRGELTLGQLDRLLPEDDGEPFALPDYRIELADAAIVIDSAWGRVAAGLEGEGNPYRSFVGTTAVLSRSLTGGGCSGADLRARGQLETDGEGVRFTGPISAALVECRRQGVSLARPEMDASLSLSPQFDRLGWTTNVRALTGTVQELAVGRLDGRSTGAWNFRRAIGNGDVRLRFDDLRHQEMAAGRGAINGRYALADGQWRADGGIALAQARLMGAAVGFPGQLRAQQGVMVIGPIAAALGNAVERAGQNFLVAAPFALRGSAVGVEADVARLTVRSASGLRLAMDGNDPVIGWRRGSLILGGRTRLSGGGFPDVRAEIVRTASGGFRGVIDSQPFRAGESALVLTALRFAVDGSGTGRFSTALGLSGPFAGGRVDGLALPLSGRIGPGGRIAVDAGCRPLRYQALALANARLGAGALQLCSLPGQSLFAVGPAGVRGGVSLAQTVIAGQLGDSPFRLTASGGRYVFGGVGQFDDVSMTIGNGSSAVRIGAGRLTLSTTGVGLGGQFSEAKAQIGTVPFNFDRLAGAWRFADRRLIIDGRMDVSDLQAIGVNGQQRSAARFEPMVIPEARLTLADGRIDATGVLMAAESGVAIADVTLTHALATGVGNARFEVVPIRFARDGLQPEALSGLVLGIAANVEATVTGNGRIDWTPQQVTSGGEFTTTNANLAAAFGPVQGLTGTIRFDDLIGLSTPPGQRVTVASINPGIEVVEGEILYQMLPNQQMRIESGRWPFAGGTLLMQPGLLNFAADQPRYLTFDVEGIDAARFLQRYGFENISATGVFVGVLPTVFDQNGGRVINGGLVVRDGGGTLAYVGELTNRDLGYFANLAFGALRSIRYDALVVRLNGNIDGEMLTEVSFTGLGQGPGATNNFLTRQIARLPFAFDIRINAPFRQLLTSARSLYDPTILIDQNLPALIRAEAAARAAQPGPTPPDTVQEQESGDDP